MITLFASIVGFISSIIPEILRLFKDHFDKKHELSLIEMQMVHNGAPKTATQGQEVNDACNMAEQNMLYATYKSGISWIDALNGSVRPVLAYSFFIMYGSVKFVQYKAIEKTAPLLQYIAIIWNIDDQAIFAGIISFYFGQRTFNKLWKHKL
jgi:hypothetical protein